MVEQPLYRITFVNQDTIYEVYAKHIRESDMFGFLEVEDFVFGENTSLVVDPAEEKLKLEFQDVKRSYIPMQGVLRIDEVNKKNVTAKMRLVNNKGQNTVAHFPSKLLQPEE